MRRVVRPLIACAATVILAVSGGSEAIAADDGVNAADLEAGKTTIYSYETTRMYECWADGAGSAPRLYQWVDKKWMLLDVSEMERDAELCGEDTPIKATYEFSLLPVGTLVRGKDYYLARVLTKCKGCQSYRWKIPFKNSDLKF